jgi:hypothetical protein
MCPTMATKCESGAEMSGAKVIAACEAVWNQDKGDCSAFARDVAKLVGVALAGNADAIVDAIRKDWTRLHDGIAARDAADAGQLVIAGLKGSEQLQPSQHGHVVVVVSGPLAHEKYPTAYWGRLGGVGARDQTLNYAWRAGDRDAVTYATVSVAE